MISILKIIADGLNGLEHEKKFPKEILKLARENQCVIISGYNDDIVLLNGFVRGDGRVDGDGYTYFDKDGEAVNDCDEECPHWKREKKNLVKIKSEFTDNGWRFETEIPDAYSVKEASTMLGKGYTTLYRWIKAGKIHTISIAGRTLIPKSEIERLK